MRNKAYTVLLGHPADPALLADATDFGHIRLHDIECARFDPWLEGLPTREYLTAGDREWAARRSAI